MKSKFTFLTICLLSKSLLFSQEFNKMSKSELKEYVVILSGKIDSLDYDKNRLQESLSSTNTNYTILEQKNKTNEIEINRLNNVNSQIEIEKNQKISEKEDAMTKLNQEIIKLNQEIAKLNSEKEDAMTKLNQEITNTHSNSSSIISTSSSNDFLNNYYFNQTPLTNVSFSLVLSKVIFDETRSYQRDAYDDNGKGAIASLPELLDAKNLTYWGVSPNNNLPRNYVFNNYMVKKNSDYVNSKLPKIEILKNKLFTLKYSDGKEESFLFNVTQTENNDNNKKFDLNNNQRKILQMELANEEVKGDGSNNDAKDIVWRIYAIENECYLVLTARQLERLKLKLFNVKDGIEIIDKEGKIKTVTGNYIYEQNFNTTGEGIYISREKDKFMDQSNYIDHNSLIYLFKLK